jgi:hypothetical protein
MYYVGLDGFSWDFGTEIVWGGILVVGDYVHPLPLVLNVWHYWHLSLVFRIYSIVYDYACFSTGLGSVICAISWLLGAVAGSHNIHGSVT